MTELHTPNRMWLRALLEARGLPIYGKKTLMAKRLREAMAGDDV